MTEIVVGLFESRGIAEDARNRLIAEGVPENAVALRVLREVGPVPSTMEPELAGLEMDPLIVGNVRDSYVRFIRNGETALFVRAATAADVEFAVHTMRQYAPIATDVLTAAARG
jgi:hypothetical protein